MVRLRPAVRGGNRDRPALGDAVSPREVGRCRDAHAAQLRRGGRELESRLMDLYPAIDLRSGKVVRLARGDYDEQTVYDDDPVAVARRFDAAGARWIPCVGLGAGRYGGKPHLSLIEPICANLRAQAP